MATILRWVVKTHTSKPIVRDSGEAMTKAIAAAQLVASPIIVMTHMIAVILTIAAIPRILTTVVTHTIGTTGAVIIHATNHITATAVAMDVTVLMSPALPMIRVIATE